MTYREKIQNMIDQINQLYEDAEGLRDMATSEEKQYWNDHRRIFYDAAQPLRKLDNILTEVSANRCVCSKTNKQTIVVNCGDCGEQFKTRATVCEYCGEQWGYDKLCEKCN